MEFWKIILGVIITVILIHFRRSYLLAQDQRQIACRLESYLQYWRGWIIDNKVFTIFHFGKKWNEEIAELIKNGDGPAEMLSLEKKKREIILDLMDKIHNDDSSIDFRETLKIMDRLPANSIDHIIKGGGQFAQNLLDGKTFISDVDASAIGPYCAQLCVRLKMNLIGATNKGLAQIIFFITSPEKFSIKDSAAEISEVLWLSILVSKDMDSLNKITDHLGRKSLWYLTWRNFIQ